MIAGAAATGASVLPERQVLKDTTCHCGAQFTHDSNFCRICGQMRPEVKLDGTWRRGEHVYVISNWTIHWDTSKSSSIEALDARTISALVGDRPRTARLGMNNRRLVWDDGSAWEFLSEQTAVPQPQSVKRDATPVGVSGEADVPEPSPTVLLPGPGAMEVSTRRVASTTAGASSTPREPTGNLSRPRRLDGPVLGGTGSDPFSTSSSLFYRASVPANDDLPAFRHLDALKAWSLSSPRGSAPPQLPTLPGLGQLIVESNRDGGVSSALCSFPATSSPRGSTVSDRHPPQTGGTCYSFEGESLLTSCAGALAAKNAAAVTGHDPPALNAGAYRVLFRDGSWGVQPSARAGVRETVGSTRQFGIGHSALRGQSLPQVRRGPAATARWLSTEGQRLHSEPWKPLGASAHASFLQNEGPERMERLGAGLIRTGLTSES